MQFETRIVNGKPSIFFKEDPVKSASVKKLTTRDKIAKKAIRKSVEISGEVDQVKPSPRPSDMPQQQTKKSRFPSNGAPKAAAGKAKNEAAGAAAPGTVTLTQEQLMAILNALPKQNGVGSQERLNENRNQGGNLLMRSSVERLNLSDDETRQSRPRKMNKPHFSDNESGDNLPAFRPPHVVIISDDEQAPAKPPVPVQAATNAGSNHSLIDRKKQKWLEEKEAMDRLSLQEQRDQQKYMLIQQKIQNDNATIIPRTGLSPEAPSSFQTTMTLGEKKRLQWQQEREEALKTQRQTKQRHLSYYDEIVALRSSNDDALLSSPRGYDDYLLLHRDFRKSRPPRNNANNDTKKYSSANDLTSFGLGGGAGGGLKNAQSFTELNPSQFNNGRAAAPNNHNYHMNEMRKSNSLNNLNKLALEELENGLGQQPQRVSLMDKKRLKWNQELKDAQEQFNPFEKFNYPPEKGAQNKNKKEALDEYQKISETVAAITAVENKIKKQQAMNEKLRAQDQQRLYDAVPNAYHDQSKVPAAMRTSLLFGDVVFEDDIKKTKELERKRWLQELDEQKRAKVLESQRQPYDPNPTDSGMLDPSKMARLNFSNNPESYNRTSVQLPNSNDEEKNFGRTRKLLDPAELDELERKRNKSIQFKREIEAQIAEKKRIQSLEEEIQELNNLKIENEARQITAANQTSQAARTQQPNYHNFEKIAYNTDTKKPDTMATILQGDSNRMAPDTSRVNKTAMVETRAQEIYRKMQEAELAAAEEKHKRLLKRLQRGGHDTKRLESKFAELKARLTSCNPSGGFDASSGGFGGQNPAFETNRQALNTSMSSDPEARLERQKQNLEKQIFNFPSNGNGDGLNKENVELNSEQKSTMKQIFQLLREDSNGFPAELTEDHLKLLLKTIARNSKQQKQTSQQGQETATMGKQQQQQAGSQKPPIGQKKDPRADKAAKNAAKKEAELAAKELAARQRDPNAPKPIWNYRNLEGRRAIPNSMKDPFYNERKAFVEERRRRRMELHQMQLEQNEEKFKSFISQQQQQSQQGSPPSRSMQPPPPPATYNDTLSQDDNMSEYSTTRNSNRYNNGGRNQSVTGNNDYSTISKPHTESIMNLLNRNVAKNTIYEEDEDQYLRSNRNNGRHGMKASGRSSPGFDDLGSPTGFVPFLRTHEVLDPAHSDSPVPPSRESSAVKRSRDKARQAYFHNMKPADYGTSYEAMNEITNRNRMKDPLFNKGLITNNPTPRQEQILSQLASLKQSLIAKQKEVASSITNDDEFDN